MTSAQANQTQAPGGLRTEALALLRPTEIDRAQSAVNYRSNGHLLILGGAEQALAAAEHCRQRVPHAFARQTLVVSEAPVSSTEIEAQLLVGRVETVTGHLGAFLCQCALEGDALVEVGALTGSPIDLVLDLSPKPVLRAELKPPGYVAVGSDPDALAEAIDQLAELCGEFEKPKYFRYDPLKCLRGRSGLEGCDRCLNVCPAWAIQSAGERIEVDPNLCQGVGTCATACPSGAIQYDLPEPHTLRQRIRSALALYWPTSGLPSLVFHQSELAPQWLEGLPESVLPVALEELGAAGLETWLAALAWGAQEVLLLRSPDVADSVAATLQRELSRGRQILEAMAIDPDRLQMIRVDASAELEASLSARPLRDPLTPAHFAANPDKRQQIDIAVDALLTQAATQPVAAALEVGSPFGSLAFASDQCTLCMACVSICGLSALMDGGDQPRLDFVESNCIQCGLCVAACPEKALALEPRYLFGAERRRTRKTLKEEAPFQCISCGKPFATQGVIQRMLGQLADHPMFAGERGKRLQMCDDCRVRDIFNEDDASGF